MTASTIATECRQLRRRTKALERELAMQTAQVRSLLAELEDIETQVTSG
jgi:hypothetical protein